MDSLAFVRDSIFKHDQILVFIIWLDKEYEYVVVMIISHLDSYNFFYIFTLLLAHEKRIEQYKTTIVGFVMIVNLVF